MLRSINAMSGGSVLALMLMVSSAQAGYQVFTGNDGAFVPNSAVVSPGYLAAQGAPTQFLGFDVDKNGNPTSGTLAVDGRIFSNLVTFSSANSASTNVDLGFGGGADAEIGPLNAGFFTGTLTANLLANGITATAAGFGLVEPGETINVFDQNGLLADAFANPSGNLFEFIGIVGTGGSQIGRIDIIGNFFAIQDFQFKEAAAAVPEPATLPLLAIGLAGFAVARRRSPRAASNPA